MWRRFGNNFLIFLCSVVSVAVPIAVSAYSGSYQSAIQDYAGPVVFGSSTWNVVTDASSSLGVYVRTGNSASIDGSWTGWVYLATSSAFSGAVSRDLTVVDSSLNGKRYLQYQILFEVIDTATSSQPIINDINFSTKRGEFWSSIFNSQTFINGLSSFAWSAALPTDSEIRFQFRSSINNSNWTPWCGPDNGITGQTNLSASCNSTSYFIATSTSLTAISTSSANPSYKIDMDLATSSDDVYFQYRAFFYPNPSSPSQVPTLNTVNLDYAWDNFTGDFLSPVLGTTTSRPFHYRNLSYTATTVNNVSWVEFQLRSGDSADTNDGSWTAWQSGVSSSTNAAQGKFNVNFSTTSLAILDGLSGHKFYQYKAILKTSDVNNFPELYDVQVNTSTYNSGWFISSWYNTQDGSAELGSLSWRETSSSTDAHPYTIATQLHTASSSGVAPVFVGGWTANDWFGPDGATTTYFTATNTPLSCTTNQLSATTSSSYCPVGDGNVLSSGANDQYIQYKVYLNTDGFNAPTISEETIGYGINVAPTFINTTANSTTTGAAVHQWKESEKDLANATTTLISPNVDMTGKSLITFALYDADTNGINAQGSSTARTPGQANLSLQYCDRVDGNCLLLSDWKTAATTSYDIYDTNGALVHDGLGTSPGFANSTTTVSIGDASTTPAKDYRLLFDFKQEANLQNKYLPSFHYRLVADDAEGANRYGYMDSGTSTLDTKAPVVARRIDASTQIGAKPATIYATTTDDTAVNPGQIAMRLNLTDWAADLFSGWQGYATTTAIELLEDPETVYYQVKDEYGNIASTAIVSPDTPGNVIIADLSNAGADIYQLFLSWKTTGMHIGAGPADFKKYVVWRATTTDVNVIESDLVFSRYAEISTSTQNYLLDNQGLASTTTYYYKVTTEDNNGDISRYQTGSNNSILHDRPDGQGRTDVTPPTIQNVAILATTTQGATIVWETDEPSDSAVIYVPEAVAQQNIAVGQDPFDGGIQTGLISMLDKSGALGQHVVSLSGLTPSTQYRYKIRSADISANFSFVDKDAADQPLIFETKPGPVISAVSVTNITNTTATIVWHTDILSDSLVSYASTTFTNSLGLKELQTPNIIKGVIDSTNDHEVKLFGLTPDTSYYFEVRSTETGNPENIAVGHKVTTASDPEGAGVEKYFDFTTEYDRLPPTIGQITCQPNIVSKSGGYGLYVAATTSEPSQIKLYYGSSSDPLDQELATTSDYNIDQQVHLAGLAASSTYFFRITATDESNNSSTTEIVYCNTIEPMIAVAEHEQILSAQLAGKVPEDEVSRRIASSSAVMLDETVPSDPNDATSTLWVQWARQGWMSVTKATAWVLASSTEAIAGMIREDSVATRIASTSDELKLSNDATSTDATSTQWVKRAREAWVPEADKEKHIGTTYTQADLDAAKAAGKSEAQASSGGGGMIIIDKTDKVAPVISDIKVTDLTATSAKVSWLTNEPASGFVDFADQTGRAEHIGFHGMFTNHWFYLQNLTPDTKYNYQLSSADASGNLASSTEKAFVTPVSTGEQLIDNLASSTAINADNEKINIETMKNAASKIMELLGQFSKVVSINTLEGQVLSQFDALQQFANIIPAPVLSSDPVIEVTPTTATIRWRTDKPANSIVAYSPSILYSERAKNQDYLQQLGKSDELVTNHEIRIIGLKPDTSYNYQIRSKSKIGPTAKSSDFTFRTRPEALEIISYTTDTVSTESATFKWLTSSVTDSEIKVIPYHGSTLAIDEAKTVTDKNTTTNHEITYREFTAGTVYQVTLSGKDGKGTRIEKVISSFSTTRDDLPPEIADIQTESALSQSKDAKVQTIITWTTNEPTISQVKFAKGVFEDEKDLLESEPIETVYSRKHTIVITKFEVGEVYSFRILAVDSGGNQTVSSPHIILTPKQKEGVFELIIRTFESTFGWLGQMKN